MRKLILALMALACLHGAAEAQQQQRSTADQGRAGTAPWPITWGAGLAVNADLRIGAAPVSVDNPVPVTVRNLPATQPVSNAGTFAVQNTSPTPAGSNIIGAVTQSGGPWSVSGTIAATQSGAWTFGLSGPIPAGSNVIGAVTQSGGPWTVADGTDGTGTNPGTGARGWLSGIYARLGSTLTATLAAGSNTIGAVTQAGTWAVNSTIQAGSAIIGRVGIDQTTPGTTNGVVVNSSALPTGASTIANDNTRAVWNTDIAATPTAGQTLNGVTRDAGASPSQYTKYGFWVYSTQSSAAGGLVVYQSTDNTNFYIYQVYTVTGGTPVVATLPNLSRYYRISFVNGGTAGTVFAASGFLRN